MKVPLAGLPSVQQDASAEGIKDILLLESLLWNAAGQKKPLHLGVLESINWSGVESRIARSVLSLASSSLESGWAAPGTTTPLNLVDQVQAEEGRLREQRFEGQTVNLAMAWARELETLASSVAVRLISCTVAESSWVAAAFCPISRALSSIRLEIS